MRPTATETDLDDRELLSDILYIHSKKKTKKG